jgi:hypothetical protein
LQRRNPQSFSCSIPLSHGFLFGQARFQVG